MMRTLAIILGIIVVGLPVFAQAPPPASVPIDPLSWIMLGAGAAVAGKKYYDSRKNRNK